MTVKVPTYGRLQLQGNRWVLSDIPPHVAIRLKSMFPRVPKHQTGVFDLPANDAMSADLQWFLQRYPMDMSAADMERLHQGTEQFEADRIRTEEILMPDWQPPSKHGFRPGLDAYHFQKQAAELWLRKKGLLLGDDVGLGKTISALYGLAGSRYLPAAIVVQAHLPTQWVNEYIVPFTYMTAHIIDGTKPYNLPPANLYVFKYSNIHGWSDIAGTGLFKAVVYDEIQELRNGTATAKGAAAKVFSDNAELRLGASATPVFNYGSEIWSIYQFIDPEILGPWEEFVREWCRMGPGQKWVVTDPDALGSYLRESQVFLRRLRQGRKINTIPVEVDFDQQVADDAEKLARALAQKVMTGSFVEAGLAARELDAFARLQTGLAKAKSVAVLARMYLKQGIPVLLAGWHRECFGAGTPVLLIDGKIKPVENIRVGEELMGPDGHPRVVQSLTRGRGKLYRIVPNKGESWICSENHILTLRNTESKDYRTEKVTVRQFLNFSESKKRRYCLYRSEAVSFVGQEAVKEPWLLGYWLGDGASNLQDFRISTADDEVVEELKSIAARYDLLVRKFKCKGGATRCCFYALSAAHRPGGWYRNEVLETFRDLGLHKNKHIPHEYLTADIESRRELLAGLLDSDGHVYREGSNSPGTVEFVNKNIRLISGVLFVARSLGLAANAAETTIRGGYSGSNLTKAYRVTISGDLTAIRPRIARKKIPVRNQKKNVLHTGFRIEAVGEGDFFGFEVDRDNLFLLGDFTVVHNCYKIWQEELKEFNPLLYTGSESAKQKDRVKKAFIEGESDCVLISLRSGAGLDGLQKRCSTVIVGEMDWAPAVVTQLVGRVDRPGQPSDEITVIYPYVNYGSDPTMMAVNAVKKDQARGINDPGLKTPAVYSDESRFKMLAKQFLKEDE